MKTIVWPGPRSKDNVLHIEAPGCIVNITRNLITFDQRVVTHVEVIPDEGWDIDGNRHNRLIRKEIKL
jgi:hypothetical protein